MIEEFERHLRGTNLSENTISSYLFAIRQYNSQYDGITKKNLRAYKVWLIENYKPKTVNLRLRAINCYLESIGKESWKMPFVRVQQKAFLEPSRGRRLKPIHSIPYSVAQPLERGSNNYYSIIQGGLSL